VQTTAFLNTLFLKNNLHGLCDELAKCSVHGEIFVIDLVNIENNFHCSSIRTVGQSE